MAFSSFFVLAVASSSCFLRSSSFLRLASLARSASTMSLGLAALACSGSFSGAGGAKRPASFSHRTTRSTMTSLMKGLTPAASQSFCSAALSMDDSSCSLASRACLARALSTPSFSCHCLSRSSMRACLVSWPLMPISLQRSFKSGSCRASSSSFFSTTTARSLASCARASARCLASWATTASIMSALLPMSSPCDSTSCFTSATGIALSSLRLPLVVSSSMRARASSSLTCSSASASSGAAASCSCSSSSGFSSTSGSASFSMFLPLFARLNRSVEALATALRFWSAMVLRGWGGQRDGWLEA
mmetsp:Transcript_59745/g.82073  ORF Transcript_59745/g.82073 Transcript_59745/m.82073 type:complete len:304 (+) Transcript_59745:370-1281(+)